MKNRGQTTVLFSCIISVLMIFTLTALEVGRIYCGRMKILAVVHSAQSSIMADYNRELFERYHLLFLDPGYGTGSDAMLEEKFCGYLETSLNGDDSVYDFEVEEVAVIDKKTIIDDHMKLLKKQISQYEKSEGLIKKAEDLGKKYIDSSKDIEEAGAKTERNATEIPANPNNASSYGAEIDSSKETGLISEDEVEDPRDVLKKQLSLGMLALILPTGTEISKEKLNFSECVSSKYKDIAEKEKNNSFSDVKDLVKVLNDSSKEDAKASLGLVDRLMFCSYVLDHFSCQGKNGDGISKCEIEYILKGKNSDHDNLEAVISDIVWMRMPVNYVCLMGDGVRQSEALTLATAICTATASMPMVEIVKYLLLGCWSYGESIYEVRMLMHGEKLPYMKAPADWNTDLKTLAKAGDLTKCEMGMDYQDYLCIYLVQKERKDITYARMLDVIQKNLQVNDTNLLVVNMCGEITMQGRVTFNKLLLNRGEDGDYECCFYEVITY